MWLGNPVPEFMSFDWWDLVKSYTQCFARPWWKYSLKMNWRVNASPELWHSCTCIAGVCEAMTGHELRESPAPSLSNGLIGLEFAKASDSSIYITITTKTTPCLNRTYILVMHQKPMKMPTCYLLLMYGKTTFRHTFLNFLVHIFCQIITTTIYMHLAECIRRDGTQVPEQLVPLVARSPTTRSSSVTSDSSLMRKAGRTNLHIILVSHASPVPCYLMKKSCSHSGWIETCLRLMILCHSIYKSAFSVFYV